ncbi:MAG TPA: UDP-2,3-diacylglucosamine diphosphatase LpxI [Terriglobales bacterium]|nr:UDP-2,3-diacylglucosamine diphosphatase LpxI [Terriglobales bacterium]
MSPNADEAGKAGEVYGLIAGNGRFPFLVLEAARSRGVAMVVAAIREETDADMDASAAAAGVEVHWLGLGQLGKLIQTFQAAGVQRAIMAGQVKHKQIFSRLRPDWKMMTLLASLATRNTDSLLGGVARVLQDAGITLESSTQFLQPLLATQGPMTARDADARERADLDYGFTVARHLAAMDIGQAVAIAECACVAAEAMEGTDAMIGRAATLAGGRPLTIVKVAKPKQDLRFDVPVVGPGTIAAMRAAGATVLGVESGITLLLERERCLAEAQAAGIAVVGQARESPGMTI